MKSMTAVHAIERTNPNGEIEKLAPGTVFVPYTEEEAEFYVSVGAAMAADAEEEAIKEVAGTVTEEKHRKARKARKPRKKAEPEAEATAEDDAEVL